MIKNAKFPGYWFHMNPYIQVNFQICIGVPLKEKISGYGIDPFTLGYPINLSRGEKLKNW